MRCLKITVMQRTSFLIFFDFLDFDKSFKKWNSQKKRKESTCSYLTQFIKILLSSKNWKTITIDFYTMTITYCWLEKTLKHIFCVQKLQAFDILSSYCWKNRKVQPGFTIELKDFYFPIFKLLLDPT